MSRFLEDDGVNESQPWSAIPDFRPDEDLELPAPEDAADDGAALLESLSDRPIAVGQEW